MIAMNDNQNINTSSDADVKGASLNVESQKQDLTSTTVGSRMSAHAVKWIWRYKGTTTRKPSKQAKMRGWMKRIYHWKNCTIVLNVHTMEIFTRSRPYRTTERMLYANWNKADKIAREFSEFAQIAIFPIKTAHPADITAAHLVINNRQVNQNLLPKEDKRKFIGKNEAYPSAKRVGAIEDGSHPGKVELVGQESAEGGLGMDWLLLDYPSVVRQSLEMNAKFSKNLELHLQVLKDMQETLKAIKEVKK
jgi:hypothetical protein